MQETRPYVLSIAGHDPCAGAGLTADIKAFEANHCYGLGVCTAITFQNDREFKGLNWVKPDSVERQLSVTIPHFKVSAVKIGIIESFPLLEKLLTYIRKNAPGLPIVFDPVLKASAGYDFHKNPDTSVLERIAALTTLITPNWEELQALYPKNSVTEALKLLGRHCAVLLKGGHHPDPNRKGEDLLFHKGHSKLLSAPAPLNRPKHGSGCVLSASITAQLAQGLALEQACIKAKEYTYGFLNSREGLLGHHHYPPNLSPKV